jgi:LysM repeat protein
MGLKMMITSVGLSCGCWAYATGDSIRYLTPKDTIFLSINEQEEKIFTHQVERKQTLYSLAKFYGISIEELYYYNPGLKDAVFSPGMQVAVPIPNRSIIRYHNIGYTDDQLAPVYYRVRKGDTMFRIAHVYFRMPSDTIMRRNKLASADIKPGQCLHVGWMNISGIPEAYRQYRGDPMERRNSAMRQVYLRANAGKTPFQDQGAAHWEKDSKEDSDFYALHRHALLNSVIEVHNPMSKRTVYVKVIGKIPDRAYRDNVVVVLSPLSAKALDAKDPLFFVRVTYHK